MGDLDSYNLFSCGSFVVKEVLLVIKFLFICVS